MTLHLAESTAFHPAPLNPGDACLDLIAWGVPFRLSAPSHPLLAQMRRHVPFGSAASPVPASGAATFSLRRTAGEASYSVMAGERPLTQPAPLNASLLDLGAWLTNHVAEWAPGYVFLHAGVVALQNRALLLPGFSLAGKSTLVAELVRAGATYYSDEFALLDPEGRVHPFPRTLQMRRPGHPQQTPLPLAQLNGCAGTAALAVSLVVFTKFVAGAPWAPESLAPGRAVLEMLLHAVPAQRTPARVLSTLSATLRHATACRSSRGEAPHTARTLLAALATGRPLA